MKKLLMVLVASIILILWGSAFIFISVKIHDRNIHQKLIEQKDEQIRIAKRKAEDSTKRLDSILKQ